MRRFSIRTLMGLVFLSAFGLATLKNANELWAGAMFLVALDAVGIAILGATFLRGPQQAWWTGFALFSGIYLALALVPWLSSELSMTSGFDYLRKAMLTSTATPLSAVETESLLLQKRKCEAGLAHMRRTMRNFNTDPAVLEWTKELQNIQAQLAASSQAGPEPTHFQRVGQSFVALLAGIFGGTVALWFHSRRERQEASELAPAQLE